MELNKYGCDYCTDECELCEEYHEMGTAFYCVCVDEEPLHVSDFGLVLVNGELINPNLN